MEYICGEAGSSKDGCGAPVLVSGLRSTSSKRPHARLTRYKYFYTCPECGAENRIPDPGFPSSVNVQTTSE